MKKILLAAALLTMFLSCGAGKSKKNGAADSQTASAENLSVAQQLKQFIEKHSDEQEIRFVYSGEIKNKDWYEIRNVMDGASIVGGICLDFSKAECNDEEDKRFIPHRCFCETSKLCEIRLPEGITEVQFDNFYKCDYLRAVYFPKNTEIKSLGGDVLSDLPRLEEVHLYNFSGMIKKNVLSDINYDYEPVLKILEMPEHPVFLEKNRDEFEDSDFGLVKTVKMGNKTVSFDEWVKMCKDIEPKNVPFKSAVVSSFAAEKYSGDRLFDNSWTSWVEGKSDEGIGESIELTLSEPTTIKSLEIKNGFGNFEYYLSNNRVKDVEIVLDDLPETARNLTLKDTPFFQTVWINDFKKPYSKIRLTIKSVYKGSSSDNDTCISEIRPNYYYSDYEADPGWKKLTASLEKLPDEKNYDWTLFPGENGKHLLSVAHYNSSNYSVLDLAGFFVWENGVWKNVYGETLGFGKTSAPESIQPVIDMIQTFKAKKIPFKVKTDNDRSELRIIPHVADNDASPSDYKPVYFEFEFSPDGFTGCKKTPFTAICFDEPAALSAFGDWKKSLTQENGKLNYLLYAAIFNQNSSMIHFLAENGYSPNEYEGYAENQITPYEASMKYNNPAAEKALEECGAEYRKELLIDAFLAGNLEQFKELSQKYRDLSFVLAYSRYALNNWENVEPPVKNLLAHMSKFLNFLKTQNVDFSQQVTNLKGEQTSLLKEALYYSPAFVDLLTMYDWKITGNEVADYIEYCKYYDDRSGFISAIKMLNEKSPFKDLSSEQKQNITWKIALFCTPEEVQYFIDQKAVDFSPILVKGYGMNITENVIYDLMSHIEEDNDYDQIIRQFVEAGADINFESVSEDGKFRRTVMGSLFDAIYGNSVYCEKHYKLFEYLYNKGARPSVHDIEEFIVWSGLNESSDYFREDEDFDLRYKYIYRYIFKDFKGPIFEGKKTLAQLLLENLNYMDELPENYPEEFNRLENCFKTIVSDLKAENCAEDWKKPLFKKAGFSKESIERIGL